MSTFILHSQADMRIKKMLNFSSHPIEHSQQSLLKNSAFFPPDNTSANKPYQSKSIPYHVFSLSFRLALFLPARQ
ncbi:hypothetical protein FF2_002904 [Malus domestica]